MSVRCGNCKNDHETSADVMACYQHAGKIREEDASDQVVGYPGQFLKQGSKKEEPVWPPSEKQITYVLGLQEERNLPEGYVVKDKSELAAMDRAEVSDLIVLLRDLSRKEGKAGGEYTMPAGRYAVQDDNNVWKFYQVDKPDKGRWKGYTFIKMLVGAPGQYNKVDMQKSHRDRILRIIEANSKQAMLDYGLHSGVCGRCSSPLSDPQSLALGMGPKCRTLSGWF